MIILIATKNHHKQREIKTILATSKHKIIFPDEVLFVRDVKETGTTFKENALLKAKAFATATKLITVADDSGLSVLSLNGEPGVNSKRWAKGSDQDRCQALLEIMETHNDRSASFNTTICFFDPMTNKQLYFTGILNGTISTKQQGNNGFGYDPIFIPAGKNQTLAELEAEGKNKLSHRGLAFRKLSQYLESQPL